MTTPPPERFDDSTPRPGERERTPISRVERLVPLYFSLSGDTSVVPQGAVVGSRIRSAEGVASLASSACLRLDVPGRRIELAHNLPASLDLTPLLGHSLRVTLVEETTTAGLPSQTLTLCGALGQVWLIARLGPVRGVVHAIGGAEVHAALSRRPDGPLVVGTRELQGLAYPGGHMRLPGPSGTIVVEFVARVSSDTAAYVLAEEAVYGG
jgi:hypothetical protein